MNDSIKLKSKFSISASKLFTLMSQPNYLQEWLSPDDSIAIRVTQFDFIEGGSYCLQYHMPNNQTIEVHGEFLEIDVPRIISFSWTWQQPDIHADIPTKVTWKLRELGNQTELSIIHEKIPHEEFMQRHKEGWLATLVRLENLIDRR